MPTDWDRLLYNGYAGGQTGGGDNGEPVGESYSALRPGSWKGYSGTAGKYSDIVMNPFQYQGAQQYIPGQVSGMGDNGDLTGMGMVANPEYSQEAYDAAKAEYMKNPTFNATRIRSGSGDDNNYQTANMKIETGPDGQQYLVPEGDWANTTKRSGNVFSDIAHDPKLQLFLAAVTAGVGGAALGLGGAGAAAGEAGLGAGSGAFLGEGIASGIPAWDTAAGLGEALASGAGGGSATKAALYGAEGYGTGMSGAQTSIYDAILEATGSKGLANSAVNLDLSDAKKLYDQLKGGQQEQGGGGGGYSYGGGSPYLPLQDQLRARRDAAAQAEMLRRYPRG